MLRVALVFFVVGGCGPTSSRPAGTTNDPVLTCERVADVCKLDGPKLGVCAVPRSGVGFVCTSQH